MREILFRGQTRRYGEKVRMGDGAKIPSNWVYGGVLQGIGDYSIIYGGKYGKNDYAGFDKHLVYTDTLGQYTGLTDKNGKKIFEGDVIKAIASNPVGEDIEATVIVILDDYELMWDIEHSHEIEVIGNIHDNPELINPKPEPEEIDFDYAAEDD